MFLQEKNERKREEAVRKILREWKRWSERWMNIYFFCPFEGIEWNVVTKGRQSEKSQYLKKESGIMDKSSQCIISYDRK